MQKSIPFPIIVFVLYLFIQHVSERSSLFSLKKSELKDVTRCRLVFTHPKHVGVALSISCSTEIKLSVFSLPVGQIERGFFF